MASTRVSTCFSVSQTLVTQWAGQVLEVAGFVDLDDFGAHFPSNMNPSSVDADCCIFRRSESISSADSRMLFVASSAAITISSS